MEFFIYMISMTSILENNDCIMVFQLYIYLDINEIYMQYDAFGHPKLSF